MDKLKTFLIIMCFAGIPSGIILFAIGYEWGGLIAFAGCLSGMLMPDVVRAEKEFKIGSGQAMDSASNPLDATPTTPNGEHR